MGDNDISVANSEVNVNLDTESIKKDEESTQEVERKPIEKCLITMELVAEWQKYLRTLGYSLDSVDCYFSFVKRYVGYGIIPTQNNVDRFREKTMSGFCSAALKSLFSFLVYKKQFPDRLLIIRFEKRKRNQKMPKVLTPSEVQILVNNMPSLKLKIMTWTIYELALRIEECLKIQWNDFNWSEWLQNKESFGKVNLHETKRGKFRVLPVKPELMKILYDNHKQRTIDGLPVGTLIFDLYGADAIKEYCLEGDIERGQKTYLSSVKRSYRRKIYETSLKCLNKRINPHMLRHSKAQQLMDHSMPIETISKFLGHESIATTQIYAQASVERVKQDLIKYDKPTDEQTG